MATTETQPASEEHAGLEEQINLRHYWHVLVERRWLVITVFISIILLSLVYLYKAPKIYEAVGRMEINRESENVLNARPVYAVDSKEQDYLQTQFKNLQSRTIVELVVRSLSLTNDPRYGKRSDPVRALQSDLQIIPIRLSRLVDIKAQNPDPLQAMRIANALMTNFIAENARQKLTNFTTTLRALEGQAEHLKTNALEAQRALEEFKGSVKMVSLESDQNIIVQGLKQRQDALDRASSDASKAEQTWLTISNMVANNVSIESIPDISSDALIQGMKKSIADKEGEWALIRARYKDKHPMYIHKAREVETLHKILNEAARQLYQGIEMKARLASATRESLEAAVQEQTERVQTLNNVKVEYEVRRKEAELNKQLWDTVIKSVGENQVTGNLPVNNMRVVDPAIVPPSPAKPRKILTLIMAVFGGFICAVGLAFFVNYLDDSIKAQDDVETYLQLPFLGYIANIKSNNVIARDLQVHLEPHSIAAEGFRTVRAAISLAYKPEQLRTVAVTSTVPEEGKSLVASNFAIVVAQTGMKTLLVDADLRRPSVHKSFQLHSPVGLSAYLTDKVSNVDEFIHTSEVPNLDLVCCGEIPTTPSELIGSKRMKQFLQEVRSRYDRVILDCPPVSAVSDPLILAAMSDGVVFVTKFNKVRREHARRSIRRIQDAGVQILGVVLNDIDFEGRDSYYYSYYYSQNKYYTTHYNPASAAGKGEKRQNS